MFLRIKKINGKEYAYRVRNKWTSKGPRQKVRGYLGRVHRLQKQRNIEFENFLRDILKKDVEKYLQKLEFDETVVDLMIWELYRHGAEIKGDSILIAENHGLKLGKDSLTLMDKPVALKMNDGYLCSYTMGRIFGTGLDEDETEIGLDFARSLVDAGLDVPEEIFVRLYEKLS